MLAVAVAGSGAAAVGERQDQTGAAAWYSPDGSTWVASSGAEALREFQRGPLGKIVVTF
jgi:hypothetical protein